MRHRKPLLSWRGSGEDRDDQGPRASGAAPLPRSMSHMRKWDARQDMSCSGRAGWTQDPIPQALRLALITHARTHTDTHRHTHMHTETPAHMGSSGRTCRVTTWLSGTHGGRWGVQPSQPHGLGEDSGRLPAPQAGQTRGPQQVLPRCGDRGQAPPSTSLGAQPSGDPSCAGSQPWLVPRCPIWKGGGGATHLHTQLAVPVPRGEGGMVTSRGSASRAAVAQKDSCCPEQTQAPLPGP